MRVIEIFHNNQRYSLEIPGCLARSEDFVLRDLMNFSCENFFRIKDGNNVMLSYKFSSTVESTLVGSKKMQKDTFMFKSFKMCSKMILSVPEHV